jgi:carboxymethylenebutenolidase
MVFQPGREYRTMIPASASRDQLRADPDDASRRDFVAASTAIGLAAAAGIAPAAEAAVVETDVRIRMPHGESEAVFFHPAAGAHPGVLVWTDAFGLRPVFRDLGRRLSAQGYAVLVPNPFYRLARPPVVEDPSGFDFSKPADRAKIQPLMESVSAPGAAEADAHAYIDYLLAQPQVDASKKLGVQGYCMGGPLTVRTAAELPDRIGAGASFHGGGLVTDQPGSPHRLAPRIKARMYFAVAASDDERQPDAKDALREAFAAAGVTAQVEVYPGTQHGWCMGDMPQRGGKPIYSAPDAERAFGKLLDLYREALGA